MANIIFNVAAKIFLVFTPLSTSMLRGQSNSIPLTLSYSNGTGQSVNNNEVLFTQGTVGQPGYFQVLSQQTKSLTGTGTLNILVNSFPSTTQADGSTIFQYDGSNVTINVNYNSLPENSDIIIGLDNREIYDFTTAEFMTAFTDYDGNNTLSEVQINGTTTNYSYDLNGTNNYLPLTSGTWIPINNVTRIRYTGADDNAAYNQTNPYKVKDENGNISL